jgi:hypothetical protein
MTRELIYVTLTWMETAMGAHCGIQRNIHSMANGDEDAYGFNEEYGWNIHIEGACGEVSFGKGTGRYWEPGVNKFKAPDIGLDIHVRTRSRQDYELIHRFKDDPRHLYVLVTGRAPDFILRGYRVGSDCRRKEWLQTHGGRPPAWFVPQDQLWPISDLIYGISDTRIRLISKQVANER